MAFLKKVRAMFPTRKAKEDKVEYVETCPVEPAPAQSLSLAKELLGEVDFSHRGDLENYVLGLTVPRLVIERWISAGLLFPEEMVTAEKMVKIMLKHEKVQSH